MRIRHFVTKKGHYHYWQPSKLLREQGFKSIRLSDNLSQATAEAEKLNASVDRWRAKGEPATGRREGTLAWLIWRYTTDDEFQSKSESTKYIYRLGFKEFEDALGDMPLSAITLRVISEYRRRYQDRPNRGNQVIASIQSMYRYAMEEGLVETNPSENVRIFKVKPRQEIWSLENERKFVETAIASGQHNMVLAIALGVYTAQRVGDLIALPWTGYDGQWISLTQEKTKKFVEVPVLTPLRALLERTPKRSTIILTKDDGLTFQYHQFNHAFREVCQRAGIKGLQFRDLRRTAVVRMAEHGVKVQDIAAITGHTLDTTQSIMETYMPRTKRMAQRAGEQMEVFYRNICER